MLYEVRATLALYTELGGHVADISTIYVTGEGSETYELRGVLPRALSFDIEVVEVEASRAVACTEIELARRVAENESALAGLLALLAAGRRADILSFTAGALDDDRVVTPSARTRRRVPAMLLASSVIVVLGLVIGGAIGGLRYSNALRAEDDARRRLAREERRADELRLIAIEKQETEAKYAHVTALLATIDSIRAKQRIPASLLADVQSTLPQSAGLERLAFDGAFVTIAGASEAATDADEFALNLQAATNRFADVSPATSAGTYTHTSPSGSGIAPEERPLERFTIRARYSGERP